tara:strand:+ start:37 stop:276 length:240 start_codon:yes stop_codon:yes gene_type:complete
VSKFKVPIWLSDWTFKDQKGKKYKLTNQIVKGYNKGTIFTDQRIVNNLVNKLKTSRSKKKLVPVNLTLLSQHGYGVEEN